MLPELPIAGHLPFEGGLLFSVTPPPAQFLKTKLIFYNTATLFIKKKYGGPGETPCPWFRKYFVWSIVRKFTAPW